MPTVSLKLSWLEIFNFLNPIIYYVILFIISFCIVIFYVLKNKYKINIINNIIIYFINYNI